MYQLFIYTEPILFLIHKCNHVMSKQCHGTIEIPTKIKTIYQMNGISIYLMKRKLKKRRQQTLTNYKAREFRAIYVI